MLETIQHNFYNTTTNKTKVSKFATHRRITMKAKITTIYVKCVSNCITFAVVGLVLPLVWAVAKVWNSVVVCMLFSPVVSIWSTWWFQVKPKSFWLHQLWHTKHKTSFSNTPTTKTDYRRNRKAKKPFALLLLDCVVFLPFSKEKLSLLIHLKKRKKLVSNKLYFFFGVLFRSVDTFERLLHALRVHSQYLRPTQSIKHMSLVRKECVFFTRTRVCFRIGFSRWSD